MWIKITALRVLQVAHGRDVILCDVSTGNPPELVIQLSTEAVAALRKQLNDT